MATVGERDAVAPVVRSVRMRDARRMIVSLPSGVICAALCSPAARFERRDVEMVVVIVGDQHEVDRRQILEGDAGRVHPLRPGEAERAGRARPRPDRSGCSGPPSGSACSRGRPW